MWSTRAMPTVVCGRRPIRPFFFFQAEDGIRDLYVTGVQTCALPIFAALPGLRLKGLLSHAGHGYNAGSETDLQSVARAEADILTTLRERAAQSGIALDEQIGRASCRERVDMAGDAAPSEQAAKISSS